MLIFIKLGGSLITNKDIPYSPRIDVIKRLGSEIQKAATKKPDLKFIIGHGSGSFGHSAAAQLKKSSKKKNHTDRTGFLTIWWAARQLNQIVIREFIDLGLPVISLPASASLISKERKIQHWIIDPIVSSLKIELMPVVFGDVVFDQKLGSVIYSTESLFSYLAKKLHPDRILLAGKEKGVFSDYPENQKLIPLITAKNYVSISDNLTLSSSTDVTGGMASKVKSMLDLVMHDKKLMIDIFSGEEENNIFRLIMGEKDGTRISR
jgi:isopentenyl phosphate kinase